MQPTWPRKQRRTSNGAQLAMGGTSKKAQKIDPTKPDWYYWTEEQFLTWVMKTAKAAGWKCYHVRNSYRVVSSKGFPDLVMARNGVAVFAELKKETGSNPTPEQLHWLAILPNAYLWRPHDMPQIQEILA